MNDREAGFDTRDRVQEACEADGRNNRDVSSEPVTNHPKTRNSRSKQLHALINRRFYLTLNRNIAPKRDDRILQLQSSLPVRYLCGLLGTRQIHVNGKNPAS